MAKDLYPLASDFYEVRLEFRELREAVLHALPAPK
jgi:hypothetical protein